MKTNNVVVLPPWPVVIDRLEGHAGMVQEDIAAASGYSQNFISNLKTKKRRAPKFDARGLRLYSLYAERVLGKELRLVPLRGRGRPTPGQAARRCA